MPFIARQERFTCGHCGAEVEPLKNGSYRNHCPHCLYSKHVDDEGPGDRASVCGGMMEPVGVDHRSRKGWMIRHRCGKCGKEMMNKTAPDDFNPLLPPCSAAPSGVTSIPHPLPPEEEGGFPLSSGEGVRRRGREKKKYT